MLQGKQQDQPEIGYQSPDQRRRRWRVDRLADDRVADKPGQIGKGCQEEQVAAEAIDEEQPAFHGSLHGLKKIRGPVWASPQLDAVPVAGTVDLWYTTG